MQYYRPSLKRGKMEKKRKIRGKKSKKLFKYVLTDEK